MNMPEGAGSKDEDLENWSLLPVGERARIVGRVAGCIADRTDSLVTLARTPQRIDDTETLSAELIPFAEACKFLQKRAKRILAPQKFGFVGRPIWLWGVRSTVERVPLGTVLVLGAWNYPMMLAGIQAAQALVAGNRVLWKPAPGCEAITAEVVSCFHAAGVPKNVIQYLPSHVEAACDAIDEGVDLIVLTGAASTGRAVLKRASEKLTPAIMELSGCDAMVVTPEADITLAAKALRFGLLLNSGATCIAPRRIYVHESIEDRFRQCVVKELNESAPFNVHPAARATTARVVAEAIGLGAKSVTKATIADDFLSHGMMCPLILENVHEHAELRDADVFAPVAGWYVWRSEDALLAELNGCRYGLGASLFGNRDHCKSMARKLNVGAIVINDIIVPTVDPRIPFGGRRESGFGITRGVEGLLAMTTTRVVSTRASGLMPHLQRPDESTEPILRGILQFRFASSLGKRLAGLQQLVRGVRLSKNKNSSAKGEPHDCQG